jgi:hypothetical protein
VELLESVQNLFLLRNEPIRREDAVGVVVRGDSEIAQKPDQRVIATLAVDARRQVPGNRWFAGRGVE